MDEPVPATDAYQALSTLWRLYVYRALYGTPDYEQLDADARQEFDAIVQDGELFVTIEDTKRAVARLFPRCKDEWLQLVSDRDKLLALTRDMYPTLVRLDPSGNPAIAPAIVGVDPNYDAAGEWANEQFEKRIAWKSIRFGLNSKPETWPRYESDNGVKNLVREWRRRHGKGDKLPQRKGGRPPR